MLGAENFSQKLNGPFHCISLVGKSLIPPSWCNILLKEEITSKIDIIMGNTWFMFYEEIKKLHPCLCLAYFSLIEFLPQIIYPLYIMASFSQFIKSFFLYCFYYQLYRFGTHIHIRKLLNFDKHEFYVTSAAEYKQSCMLIFWCLIACVYTDGLVVWCGLLAQCRWSKRLQNENK